MYIGRKTIEYDYGDEIVLCALGDFHVGNRNFAKKELKERIKEIKANNWLCIGMGDFIEGIVPNDGRYDGSVIDPKLLTADEQSDYVIDLLYPIKEQIIAVLTGNHEDKVRQRFGVDITKKIANELETEYWGYNALYRLSFKRSGNSKTHYQRFDVYATHGYFTGFTRSGRITKIERLAEWVDATLYLMAHTHDLNFTKTLKYSLNNKATDFITKELTFVHTGGYLHGYKRGVNFNYTEKKMYKPLKIGSPIIRINPEPLEVRIDGI